MQNALLDLFAFLDQACVGLAQHEELCVDLLFQELALFLVDIVVGADGGETRADHPVEVFKALGG